MTTVTRMVHMPSEISLHQLCTDCKKSRRALADGITGCASLCVKCFDKRIADAKAKKKPKRVGKGIRFGYTEREYDQLMDEAMNTKDEDLHLENLEEL